MSDRGTEEIGWDLLGTRQGDSALVLATLPAGEARDAGTEHVQFNRAGQEFAWRILRQQTVDCECSVVVQRIPVRCGTELRGDYRGDIEWVANLKGQEGVFGIGTADAEGGPQARNSWKPAPQRAVPKI